METRTCTDGSVQLTNILTTEELEKTPSTVKEKLKQFLDGFYDKYYEATAAANRLSVYEQKTEDLESQIQDYQAKLQIYDQNVLELRNQLDAVSAERAHLLESSNACQKELASMRLEKNTAFETHDNMLKVIERLKCELERTQVENRTYYQQLRSAITAKCEAIARVDEIEGKEVSLEFKERRMVQERTMLQNQIQALTEDLDRNITELQNIRRENTVQNMHLEARLAEKIEELKIAQSQCAQYKETIDRLHQNVQELSSKNLHQNEESQKMMDFYKKELEAKAKLAELYKSNCDDIDMERNELGSAIVDLKRMLQEASEQYGELETNFKATCLQHEQDIEEKEKKIESLQTEIRNANVLLKDLQHETVENAISKMAPSAAIASRLIRTDISLTELYSLYVKTSEELDLKNREVARLKLQHNTILQELSESAPNIQRQEIDHEKLKELYNIILQQRDDLLMKKADMEELMQNAHAKIGQLERDNKRLKHSQSDLSRQVCYLLKEIEHLRDGLPNESGPSQTGVMTTADEVISKKLVTFSHIVEMQENNQKLLTVVRDLSTQLDETEKVAKQLDLSSYKDKLVTYVKKMNEMQETLNQQNSTISMLLSKTERYKKMFFQLSRRQNKDGTDDLSELDESELIEADVTENVSKVANSSTPSQKNAEDKAQRRISELEQQLNDMKDQYKTLKEQHEYYAKEKKDNEKILNEQFDSMRTEVRELTSANCKMISSLEYTKEQIKLQQKNIATYKNQITALENRNKNYESTIIKHEQTVHYLKDEIMKTQRNYSKAESEVNNLRHESRMLKDTVTRLQTEKEGFHRDHQSQSLLLNNLELIKSNLERSEIEGRARLEQRLDDTVRELSAQRRRFQEEEDRFREVTADLKRQTEMAKKLMEEERDQADQLRTELVTLQEELNKKTQNIDELSKKLQESLTPSKNDNPIVLANKKAREFEVKCEEARIEIEALTAELAKAREHAEQYFKMSQSAEKEIKNLHDVHTASVAKSEAEIKQLQMSEMNLKSQLAELEADVQLARVNEISSTKQPDQLRKLQDELKDALQKLSECNRSLRTLRGDNSSLAESLNAVEMKYANEMVLHSADIQELTKIKAELSTVQEQINELSTQRDSAQIAYEELKKSHESSLEMLLKEKEELEKRIVDMNGLNSSLHDQIEAITSRLTLLSQSQTGGNTSMNDSMTAAALDASGVELNRSDFEAECKNSDQLLQIIKYLRKEKDLIDAKLDILKAENTRLLSENTILQKKVQELNGFLHHERTKSEAVVISATKHEEILRKIETLNAITDSNRSLREERNALSIRVKELNDRISSIEDELFPLQNQNRELLSKIEELSTENTSLRTEAIKWRQRANILVEKSNKNPEEFKRLQLERESLAKMLTTEKEQVRQALDEVSALKADKMRHESELAALERQLLGVGDEKKKMVDEFMTVKQNAQRMMQELMELKNKLLQKEEMLQKLSEEVEQKEAQLQDSKNKEIQIRKIAKRYKDSYMELMNKQAASGGAEGAAATSENMEIGTNAVVGSESVVAVSNAVAAELEQNRSTIDGLNNLIRSMQDENEKMRKDFEEIKKAAEIDERTKMLLREAKTSIVNLQEQKNAVVEELGASNSKLKTTTESKDAEISAIKSQYEEALARVEELVEQNNHSKELMTRLSRENETLQMRINQLSRQLGLQQTAKPSTSSVANSDKSSISESSPRTANVKPMSGSTTVQQSATVTPWRGETPLASIRPISMQNSRTAAILPTSQQTPAGGSSSTSSSSSSSSSTSTSTSSSGSSNTALVPPQQQVHTTGTSSVESMSSSPTSSHTDYMPSTSSASVAVAAVPPMGTASAAESSQEAESIQQQQPNESQPLLVSGGQLQVVALVSPRVEASSQNAPSPNLQQLQQEPNNQQPSTSGTTSSTSHIAVSSHSRHTPSSSSVTTTQATGSSGGHKRPRDQEGDSSTSVEDSSPDKANKHPKRMRTPLHGESGVLVGVTDSEVEYQVPTSSQRDQEDDIVVVDSEEDEEEEEEEDGMAEADDGPADGDTEHEGYEDSYEQDPDQDMDENDCPEINESNMRGDDVEEPDNNEVDVDECHQMQCTSDINNQAELAPYVNENGASTSQAAAAALAHSQLQDNHQQSQAISSGSYETNPPTNAVQPGQGARGKTAPSLTRQQKATLMMLQQGMIANVTDASEQDPSGSRRPDGSPLAAQENDCTAVKEEVVADGSGGDGVVVEPSVEFVPEEHTPKKSDDPSSDENNKPAGVAVPLANPEDSDDADEEFVEETAVSYDNAENVDSENHQQDSSGATQSEIQDIQQSQLDVTSEENEGADGVSSEGEKQAVEEMEEEGREAEATPSPSINTRSKSTKGSTPSRRPSRGFQRGGRPTPITWQESPGNSRNMSQNHRGQEQQMQQQQQPASGQRGFTRGQRARRMRRPSGSNYTNMRFS